MVGTRKYAQIRTPGRFGSVNRKWLDTVLREDRDMSTYIVQCGSGLHCRPRVRFGGQVEWFQNG